ncbi:phospholipase-like protein [Artemisia annua]|uniref:Phospholipase-like protein n=1 Tax=Artemisia annua TaxID=35608 RepID=A0A2U1KRA8_ARTAN|nr:phospholipase-like protein [Artemisia annua]
MFKSSVFGPWLDIKTEDHQAHLLNFLLFHQRNVEDATFDTPFIFDIGQHTVEMGRREFCLITGFRFGDISLSHLQHVKSRFMKRVFPGYRVLKGKDLYQLLEDQKFKLLSEPDALRVCLLLAGDYCFMGQEIRHMVVKEFLALIDDLDAWNAFPWGEHMWQEFHDRNYMLVTSKRDEYMREYAMKGSAYQAVYNLWGFAFALKVLVLETFPQSKLWWQKDENAFPRGVGWRDVRGFSKYDYNSLFYAETPIKPIIPTDAERASLWWISSIEYLDNPIVSSPRKNKKVKRDKIKYRVCQNFHQKGKRTSVHIRTEVHTSVVDDGSSHEDDSSDAEVDESLKRMSNKELLKYVSSMEGRLAAVEKLVKPRKVPIDVTVPPVNHPAKEPVADAKIVIELNGDVEKPKEHMEEDMEEEVVKESMEEDVEEDTDKKNTEEDAVDHNEKDDSEFKDIFGSPTPKDSPNDLTDFKFFSSLPDDLFQDTNGSLDQQMNVGVPQDLGPVPDKSGINEVINERLDEHMGADVTQAEKQEPALSPIPEDSLIDVDASDGIKTVKVPFERARKKSRHISSPYTPPPPTTPKRSRKCRTSSRMYKSTMQKMIGPDGSELQLEPWVEQLTRPQGSPEGVVNQHPEITLLLRSRKDMKFQLPWVNGDFYNKFWIGLAGKDRNRRGWLSDWHIDVWFQYIWHFRQKDADWVMVGPYFNAQILYRDVPFYYADGVTYGVPWTDESVEKMTNS